MKFFECKKNIALVGVLFLISLSVCASEKVITLLLPINVASKEGTRLNLRVSIPNDYKVLGHEHSFMNTSMAEFIPVTDDKDAWSRIITTHAVIGVCVAAQEMHTSLKNLFVNKNVGFQIIREKFTKNSRCESAQLLAKYIDHGRNEILYSYYLSGPFDCSGYQYSVALTDKTDLEAIVDIAKFTENNTSIVEF